MTQDVANLVQRAIAARRLQLNTLVYQRLGGVVRYGPLAGMRLIEASSWGNDKCAKLLGFYEQELMAAMVPAMGPETVFVDIGAADGFYAVGALKAGLAHRTIAFELTEAGRAVIADTAQALGVDEKIEILGACSEASLAEALTGLDRRHLVVLCDVEGAEFDILSDAVLASLAGAHVFIEIHDHSEQGPAQYAALRQRAARWFRTEEIRKAGRNPYHYAELRDLDDTDHWLVCSEGRDPDQKWLALRPIHG
ncbi:MAG: hypothetical protein KBC73_07155 [Burkholderiaceae bacterium]|nr:hypothetical protein [Burkholderiaceae bacterium]